MPIDYKKYPDNWPDIRERIMDRAIQKGHPRCEWLLRQLDGVTVVDKDGRGRFVRKGAVSPDIAIALGMWSTARNRIQIRSNNHERNTNYI